VLTDGSLEGRRNMGQPVAFFEILNPDHERAQKFYRELFGWQLAADPATGGYGLVDAGGEGAIGSGIGRGDEPGEKRVKIYMRVDDLDAHLDPAESWARCPPPRGPVHAVSAVWPRDPHPRPDPP
jgi:predicted enzyme related to lactoylglutathione lyase